MSDKEQLCEACHKYGHLISNEETAVSSVILLHLALRMKMIEETLFTFMLKSLFYVSLQASFYHCQKSDACFGLIVGMTHLITERHMHCW